MNEEVNPATETPQKPRTIRIFISSPGDVQDERDRARQVIQRPAPPLRR